MLNTLSFIHFFASVRARRVNVLEAPHQSAVRLDVAPAGGVGLKPFVKGSIEGFVFGLSNLTAFSTRSPSALRVVLVTTSVYTSHEHGKGLRKER